MLLVIAKALKIRRAQVNAYEYLPYRSTNTELRLFIKVPIIQEGVKMQRRGEKL